MRSIRKFAAAAAAVIAVAFLGVAGFVFGGGGATGTGYIAFGSISDFGSIFVNGIEFFTDKASITINGVPNRPESDLRIGMALTVNGVLDSSGVKGTASSVEYHANALGMIDRAPDAASGTFGVLGQVILTNARTVFANVIDASQLQLGDYVEVSGFPGPGGLLATRVERKTSMPTVQVQGVLANLSGTTFTLGTLTVDDSIATFKNVPSGGLANGQTLVVVGPTPQNGFLQAQSVEVLNTSPSGGTNGSVSGVIATASPTLITVNGLALVVSGSTQWVNGGPSDLAVGLSVKVDYTVIASTAYATRIEYTQLSEPSYVEANVTAKNPSSVELLGPGGVLVTANSATQFQDNSGANLKTMTLADLNVGDHLQVEGRQVDSNVLLATKVVRRKPTETAIVIEGRALSVAQPVFTIIDLGITVTSATDLRDSAGSPITADVFFAQAAGHDVSVSAALQDGVLVAISARID